MSSHFIGSLFLLYFSCERIFYIDINEPNIQYKLVYSF